MRTAQITLYRLGLATALMGTPVLAQYAGPDPAPQPSRLETTDIAEPQRKEPRFFRKPQMDTPAEQFAYARQLAAAGKRKHAAKAFRNLVHAWHDAPQAAAAQRAYAEWLFKRGAYAEAFEEFQYLIVFYPDRIAYTDVLERQFQIANQLRGMRYGDFLFLPGFAAPEKAIPYFRTVVENGPNWEHAPEAQFQIGLIYEESGQLDEAVAAYELLGGRYPDSDYAAGAAFRKAECLTALADRMPRDERSCREAMAALAAFIRDYHGDPNVAEARQDLNRLKAQLADMYYERALFYDRIAKRPESAVIAYGDFIKKFPESEQAEVAAARLTELRQGLEQNQ